MIIGQIGMGFQTSIGMTSHFSTKRHIVLPFERLPLYELFLFWISVTYVLTVLVKNDDDYKNVIIKMYPIWLKTRGFNSSLKMLEIETFTMKVQCRISYF